LILKFEFLDREIMHKLVVFSLSGGDLNCGFTVVTAQLWDHHQPYPINFTGSLPPAPELPELYRRWQLFYEALNQRLGLARRIKIHSSDVTNISVSEFGDVCQKLQNYINAWLHSEEFQNIEQQLRTLLDQNDEIRIIIKTDIALLHRLPWHLWNFFEDYHNAEVALSPQNSPRPPVLSPPTGKVKILAILGNSNGIDVEKDRILLKSLPLSQTEFLAEPTRQELDKQLWDRDWDILFFAGHSSSQVDGETGVIYINQTESLTIPQLKNALKTAISRGLKLAIFNSCDGVGLARNLADLNIPQVIVMREPVPDLVAQEFLKNFLAAFAGGKPFYSAVREARERLQGLENEFPSASWLPVICQNPTVESFIWPSKRFSQLSNRWRKLGAVLLMTSIVATTILSLRYVGVFQKSELQAFDQMLQMRSPEEPNLQLLVVEVTDTDIQTLRETTIGPKSISDNSLAKLLHKLQQYQPRVIGIDIYRDIADPVNKSSPLQLTTELSQPNVVAVCKAKDDKYDRQGVKPPQGVPQDRQGFTDALHDPDGILRRQILMMPEEKSPCTTKISLNLQLAARYLFNQGKELKFSQDNDYIQFGSTVFPRLKPGRSGAYQRRVDLGGFQILLNYRAADFPKVSVGDVLSGAISPDFVKDKVVIIGVTAKTTSDTWPTPFSAVQETHQGTPGVFIQAQMVSQILSAVMENRQILWVLPDWGDILWIYGWSLIGGLIVWCDADGGLCLRSLLGHGCLIIATTIVLYGVCAAILFIPGAWLPFIPSAFAIVISSTTILILTQSVGLQQQGI
jgi:CHASE2 domain-containing sensor protein